MREVARTARRVEPDVAAQFEAAHNEDDPSHVPRDTLESLLAEPDETVTVEDVAATENAARPKSILTGDSTVENDETAESYMFEVLCSEQHVLPDDVGPDIHDDGTRSYTVGELADATVEHTYETLELIRYTT